VVSERDGDVSTTPSVMAERMSVVSQSQSSWYDRRMVGVTIPAKTFSARFMVFPETHGPVLLNVFLAEQPYDVERNVSRRGASFSSMQALTDALTKSGLPGKEISSVVQPHALGPLKTYTVSSTQVELLGLAGLE
jgi:hypothetical protein